MISTPSLQNNSISSSGTLESKFRSLYLASQDVMFVIYWLALALTLVTHQGWVTQSEDTFEEDEEDEEDEEKT